MAATKIRLHYSDGRVVTQSLHALGVANGVQGRANVQALIARWVEEGALKKRADGGYDVKHYRAPKRASAIRSARGLLDGAIGGLLSGE